MAGRKSDDSVVLMRTGNAEGGKAVTNGLPLLGKH